MAKRTMKKYTAKEKFAAVLESYITGDITATANRHGVHVNMLSKWRGQLKTNGEKVFDRGLSVGKSPEQIKIEKLERIIGRQAIQIDFLEKVEEMLR